MCYIGKKVVMERRGMGNRQWKTQKECIGMAKRRKLKKRKREKSEKGTEKQRESRKIGDVNKIGETKQKENKKCRTAGLETEKKGAGQKKTGKREAIGGKETEQHRKRKVKNK